MGGSTAQTVKKLQVSNLAEVAESADYGGTIYALAEDTDYVYVAGITTQTVWKLQKSDMTQVAESANYGSVIRALAVGEAAPSAPTVTTNPATNLAALSTTLNGTLDDDGGEACDVRFQYGETSEYGIDTEWQSGKESVVAFEQAITGLSPNTIYHFRAQAKNSAGTTSGADRTFTTLVATPTVTTDPASGLSAIAATPNGTLDDDGGEACDCGFVWGPDTGYGVTTPTQSKTKDETFSQVIRGLFPETTYHFRAFATNSAGTSYGADGTFTTKPVISRAYALARRQL
ncbi:hypothetical protein ES703_103805 [subsurface metagenome]